MDIKIKTKTGSVSQNKDQTQVSGVSQAPFIHPPPLGQSTNQDRSGGSTSPGPHWRRLDYIKQLRPELKLDEVQEILYELASLIRNQRRWEGKEEVVLPLLGYPGQTTTLKTIEPEEITLETQKADINHLWPSDYLGFLLQLGGWFIKNYPKETSSLKHSFPEAPDKEKVLRFVRSLATGLVEHGRINERALVKSDTWFSNVVNLLGALLWALKKVKETQAKTDVSQPTTPKQEPATAKVATPTSSKGPSSSGKDTETEGAAEPAQNQQSITPDEIKKALKYEHAWLYNRVLHEYLTSLGIDPYSAEGSEFKEALSQEVLEFLAKQDHIELALTFADLNKRDQLFKEFVLKRLSKGTPLTAKLEEAYIKKAQTLTHDPEELKKFLEKTNIRPDLVSKLELDKKDLKNLSPPRPKDAEKEISQALVNTLGGEFTPQQALSLKKRIDTLLLTYGDNQLIEQALKDPILRETLRLDPSLIQLEGRLDFFALVDRLSPEELVRLFNLDTGTPNILQQVAHHLPEIKEMIKNYAHRRALELAAVGGVTALLGTAHIGETQKTTEELDLNQVDREVAPLVNLVKATDGQAVAQALGRSKEEVENYAEKARQEYIDRLERVIAGLPPSQQLEVLSQLGVNVTGIVADADEKYLSYIQAKALRERLLIISLDQLAQIIRAEEAARKEAVEQELQRLNAIQTVMNQALTAQEIQQEIETESLVTGMPPLAAAYAAGAGTDQSVDGNRFSGWLKQRALRNRHKQAKKLLNQGLKKAGQKLATKLGLSTIGGPAGLAASLALLAKDKEFRKKIANALKILAGVGLTTLLLLSGALKTLGGWLGGIGGSIAGFFIGGPAGAAAGFFTGALAGWQFQEKLLGSTSNVLAGNQALSPSHASSYVSTQTQQAAGAEQFAAHQATAATQATSTAVAGSSAGAAISQMGVIAPLMSIGLVVTTTLFTIFTIYASFLAPIPEGNYAGGRSSASHYLELTKSAQPKKLPNQPQEQPVTYTITLKPRAGYTIKLKEISGPDGKPAFIDDRFLEQRYKPGDGQETSITPTSPKLDLSYLEPEFTRANPQKISYTVNFNGGINVLVINQVRVKFDVYKQDKLVKADQEVKVRTGLSIGTPKVFCWPVNGVITQLPLNTAGGVTSHGDERADAFDIGAITGTPVYAPISGRAYFKYDPDGFGHYVIIESDDPIFKDHRFAFAHLSQISPDIGNEGNPTQVDFGQLIGLVGSSGKSTGPHLHFELITSARGRYPKKDNPLTLLDFFNLTAKEEAGLLSTRVYTCW